MKNLSIFFDTNIIESRFSVDKKDFFFHDKIVPNGLFREIKNYVKRNGLEEITSFYIPDISWREFEIHLIEGYNTSKSYIEKQTEIYQKSFGSNFTILYEFTHDTEEKYRIHLNTLKKEFLIENRCEIIDYPKELTLIDELITKCLNKQYPFKSAKVNGKEYHDAGLKDALIWKTLVRYQEQFECQCIFVTRDSDFISNDKIYVCSTFENFCKFLENNRYVATTDSIKHKIEGDAYLKESIVSETGNKYDESVTEFVVTDITEDDGLYNVSIKAVINESIYNITGKYDISPNELLDINFEIENE